VIRLTFLFLVLVLTGCAQTVPISVVNSGCLWALPIYVSEKDIFTNGTATQILSHNEKWKANCK